MKGYTSARMQMGARHLSEDNSACGRALRLLVRQMQWCIFSATRPVSGAMALAPFHDIEADHHNLWPASWPLNSSPGEHDLPRGRYGTATGPIKRGGASG